MPFLILYKKLWPIFIKVGFAFFCVLMVSTAIYSWHLNKTIKEKFDGRRWAIPARVYARPLELYPGKKQDMTQLEKELLLSGYRLDERGNIPGSFHKKEDQFHIVTRKFDFGDQIEPSKNMMVAFSGDVITEIREKKRNVSANIVRIDPVLIGSFLPKEHEDRLLLSRNELPEVLVKTLLAVEDRSFYRHHGIDLRGIIRAVWVNIRSRAALQGGSTLTQQLVKNFFLTNERTLRRKVNEAIMAVLLDWQYSKDEILTAYANEIFLGQDGGRAIHGLGLASQFYFQRNLEDLDTHQIALLVGIIKGPSYFNPRKYPERCQKRRRNVLQIMREVDIINTKQFDLSSASPLMDTEKNLSGFNRFPEFLELVRRQLHRDYQEDDLTSNGLKIFTTLDPEVQWKAEETLSSALIELERKKKIDGLDGAVIVTNRNNGEIEAVVGSRFPGSGGFNRALDANRPIGSLVKPAVYLAAVEKGYRLMDILDDTSLVWNNHDGSQWIPRNFDRKEHGRVPLYRALIQSYNLATVKLGISVGIEKVAQVLERLGLEKEIALYPSLLLGAIPMSPLEVCQLYQTFSGEGFYTKLRSIIRVLDSENRPLKRFPLIVEKRIDGEHIFLINTALQKVVERGTAKSLSNYIPSSYNLAGKTGTSDGSRDSWFAGFSGDKLSVVWLGKDDNSPINLTGATGALTVWGKMMSQLKVEPLKLTEPPGIKWVLVSKDSSQADDRTSGILKLPFLSVTHQEDKEIMLRSMENTKKPDRSKNVLEKILKWLF